MEENSLYFQSLVISHPGVSYSLAAAALAVFCLSPTPVLLPLIALVTILRLSAWTFLPRAGERSKAILQVLLVSAASAVVHLEPSLTALSTPNLSLVIVSLLSLLTSTLGVATIWAGCYAVRFTQAPWAQLTLFPALWASVWGTIAHVSPVGQLVTWSPVIGLGPYSWVREYLGQWGIDWITAAWAVVLSETAGNWLVGSVKKHGPLLDDVEPQLLIDEQVPYQSVGLINGNHHQAQNSAKPLSRSRSVLVLTGSLLLLMIPTYAFPSLPLPINNAGTTPFSVSCVLPSTPGRIPGLDDFIAETRTVQAVSDVIIWPESAVRFDSPEHKLDAFARIQTDIPNRKYVGVSFEEYDPALRSSRNGFALIGKTGAPVLEYYKRNLVPIAESFSLTHGTEPPPIFTVELGAPKGVKRPEWAPSPNFTRPIPLTTSICLDFASSSSFTDLDSRPALILAPARTWHVGIGHAMWEQAQARARETGSTIFWCDGGDGGLGGIAGPAYSELIQVGGGSWSKKIGIHYPFDHRRTFFSAHGESTALVVLWGVLGLGWVGEAFLVRYRRDGSRQQTPWIQWLGRLFRTWRGIPNSLNPEERSLLHD